jgi:hypothetical protein
MDLTDTIIIFDALHGVRVNLAWLVTQKEAHYLAVTSPAR